MDRVGSEIGGETNPPIANSKAPFWGSDSPQPRHLSLIFVGKTSDCGTNTTRDRLV